MPENSDIAISLENVSKTFVIRDVNKNTLRDRVLGVFSSNKRRKIEAVKNINLQVKKGEFIGIIGRNGSGKSTLVHLMTGTYLPDKGGKASINGKFMRLSLGMGFNPQLSARQNINLNASLMGLTLRQIKTRFDAIIDFAGLNDFVDTKIKYFSSGMKTRLAFSVAIHAEAEIFLLDEFFGGVGDAQFRQKAFEVFKKTIVEGKTVVLISHGLDVLEKNANRVLVMEKGEAVALCAPAEAVKVYKEIVNK